MLAAIGTVESGSGQSNAPGVWSGANGAGAEGPMQFEPATFAAYATVGPGGARPPSPYDPVDAVYTAAALLCADGAGSPATLRAAIDDYNHSDHLRRHRAHPGPRLPAGPVRLGHGGGRPVLRRPAARHPLPVGRHRSRRASTARGWSRPPTGPRGSPCPGWPRTSSTPGRRSRPGLDGRARRPRLLRDGPAGVDHVGLYVGAGEMIDAPYTGALVRFDVADQSGLVGATRPG